MFELIVTGIVTAIIGTIALLTLVALKNILEKVQEEVGKQGTAFIPKASFSEYFREVFSENPALERKFMATPRATGAMLAHTPGEDEFCFSIITNDLSSEIDEECGYFYNGIFHYQMRIR